MGVLLYIYTRIAARNWSINVLVALLYVHHSIAAGVERKRERKEREERKKRERKERENREREQRERKKREKEARKKREREQRERKEREKRERREREKRERKDRASSLPITKLQRKTGREKRKVKL